MVHKFRKGLVIGIICLMMLLIFPYNVKSYDYPPEDGPYTVYVSGISRGFGYSKDIEDYFFSNKLPFWDIEFPSQISYHFGRLSVFNVNGEMQRVTYPAKIIFYGFKGFAPTNFMHTLKILTLIGRIRVIGQCKALSVM